MTVATIQPGFTGSFLSLAFVGAVGNAWVLLVDILR
jgi:hypothetical protein